MSKQNANQFMLEIQKDMTAYRKLPTMDGRTVVELARTKGYPCTIDDIKAVVTEAKQSRQSLSDAELAQVAGGKSSSPIVSIIFSCDCPEPVTFPENWLSSSTSSTLTTGNS